MANGREKVTRPTLVAHRGYSQHYPENTLIAIAAALDAGAAYVEFDVQMTADGVPVVLHDVSLRRTGGVDERVVDLPLQRVREIVVSEPQRLGNAFPDVRVSTLAEMVTLLEKRRGARAFVEVKRSSLRHFGTDIVVDRVMEDLRPVLDRCVVISFDRDAVVRARRRGAPRIGWVIETWDEGTNRDARTLAPDYLLCEHLIVPDGPTPFWPGPWRWVVYGIADAEHARRTAQRGADFIETKAIGELLADPLLGGSEWGGETP